MFCYMAQSDDKGGGRLIDIDRELGAVIHPTQKHPNISEMYQHYWDIIIFFVVVAVVITLCEHNAKKERFWILYFMTDQIRLNHAKNNFH